MKTDFYFFNVSQTLHVNNNDYHKTFIVWRNVKNKSCLPIVSLES